MLGVEERQMIVAKALVEVNKARAGLNGCKLSRMPIATPANPSECAVQRGLRDVAPQCRVMASSIMFTSRSLTRIVNLAWYGADALVSTDNEVPLPPAIVDFISHFDSFGLPEMIDPAAFVKCDKPTQPDALARWEAAQNWLVRQGKLPASDAETTVTDQIIQVEILDPASVQASVLAGV